MPILPIPFTSLDKAADKLSETWSLPQNQQDGYWQPTTTPDGQKFLWVTRPGLTELCTVGATSTRSIVGLYWYGYESSSTSYGVAVNTSGEVFRFGVDGSSVTDITGSADLAGSTGALPFSFASIGSYFFIAHHGAKGINRFTLTAASGAVVADAQAPNLVWGITKLNNILVAQNRYSSRFDWSDAGDGTAWSGYYASCEYQTGLTQMVYTANGYLYFFRTGYIEIWRDDSISFTRETVINTGALYQTAICQVEGDFYFLGEDFTFYELKGFSLSDVGNPFMKRLFGYKTQTDGVYPTSTIFLPIDGKRLVLVNYAAGPSYVFDIDLRQWYQWGTWNGSTYDPYLCRQLTTTPIYYSKVVGGSRADHSIYSVSGTTDDGTTIRTVLQTDQIDRGKPDTYKYCHELIFKFKRSNIPSGTPKTITLNYRDEGSTTWSSDVTVQIEAITTTDFKANSRRLGRYKTRQWRFVNTDASSAALMEVLERFDYGR